MQEGTGNQITKVSLQITATEMGDGCVSDRAPLQGTHHLAPIPDFAKTTVGHPRCHTAAWAAAKATEEQGSGDGASWDLTSLESGRVCHPAALKGPLVPVHSKPLFEPVST